MSKLAIQILTEARSMIESGERKHICLAVSSTKPCSKAAMEERDKIYHLVHREIYGHLTVEVYLSGIGAPLSGAKLLRLRIIDKLINNYKEQQCKQSTPLSKIFSKLKAILRSKQS